MKKIKVLKQVTSIFLSFVLSLSILGIYSYAAGWENGLYTRKSDCSISLGDFSYDDPYYTVNNGNKIFTLYSGTNVKFTPRLESSINEICGYAVPQVHKNGIKHIVFTCDYEIEARTLHCMSNLKTIRFYNNAKVNCDSYNFYNCGKKSNITVYGTNENNKQFAETFGFQYKDLNEYSVESADGYNINIGKEKTITGIETNVSVDTFVGSMLNASGCDVISADKTIKTVGTGTKFNVVKWIDGSIADTYTAVLFGDVDGDGKYDGADAYKVNLMVNGHLTKEQVGNEIWAAADCNHDGVIDTSDVALLERAGLLLTKIDQSKTPEELKSDEAYIEYESLIDQSAEPNADIVAEPDEPKEPETESESNLVIFIKKIVSFIKEIISKILSLIK